MSDILTRAHELEADLAALGISANHSLIHVGSGALIDGNKTGAVTLDGRWAQRTSQTDYVAIP